jgi:hypothetical protein
MGSLLFLVAGLLVHEVSCFSLVARALPTARHRPRMAALDQSLSSLLAADVKAAAAATSWAPKAVPLLESTAQHVIIDDTFAHQEKVGLGSIP